MHNLWEINDVSVLKCAKRMLIYCVLHSQLSMDSLSMLPINHVMDVRKRSWFSAQLVGFAWITQVQLKYLIGFHVV